MKSPILNGKLEVIDGYVFGGCDAITNISIPGSVKSFGEGVFAGCDSLRKISFEVAEMAIEMGADAFCKPTFSLDVDTLELYRIIPKFQGLQPKHVIFGECWDEVPKDYFLRNGSIGAIKELISVTLPPTLKKIGEQAFYYCSSLSVINFPESLINIDDRAFYGCTNIDSIYTAAKTPPTCGSNVFTSSIYPKTVVTVPLGSRRAYAKADTWENFVNLHTDGALLVTVEYDHAKGEVKVNDEIADSLELDEGESLDVAINPAIGFAIESVTANGEICTDRLVNGVLHYDEISDTLAIVVKFTPIMFDIKFPTEINGGHIEINGREEAVVHMQYGSRLSLRPVADEGYLLKSMSINGAVVELDTDGNYVIESLTESISVYVVFEIIRFNVSAKYDRTFGMVTLNSQTGDILVDYGSQLTIKAMPADGHYVGELKVNGAGVNHELLAEPVVIENVKEDIEVEVTFDIYTYSVSATYDNTLGSVSINGSECTADVPWGMDAIIAIMPAYGYQIASVDLDGCDVTDEVNSHGKLTIKAVKTEHNLTVVFEIKRVRLSIAMEGGALTTVHDFGTELNYFPEPEDGWTFHSATVGDQVITTLYEDGSFTVGPMSDDTMVSVVFHRSTDEVYSLSSEAIKVTVCDNTIVIAGALDEAIAEVYDTAGLRYYSGLERAITLEKSGVYIVTISGQSFKVILR